MSASKPPPPPPPPPPPSNTFEFTKRKRWADLLIHELSDAIIFVLSPDAKIWFCGRAVAELLGWSDAELIDRPFTDLVNPEDQRAFYVAFDESLRTHTELNAYVRLRTRSAPSEVLFEMKGYPHFVENDPFPRCFFAVAKPYPSRNIAMLNTYLELKIENERLQRRLAELRVRAPSPISGPSSSPMHSLRASSLSRPAVPSVLFCPSDPALCPQHVSYDSFSPAGQDASLSPHSQNTGVQPTEDDLGDDTSRRKKMRKSHSTEQYVCVTCGRTDSPEWRKGPQGPKTLCNACGLRWAKEVRSKVDEGAAPAGTDG